MKPLILAVGLLSVAAGSDDVMVSVGDPAPNFEGDWLNHPSTSLEDLEGRVVFVEFWRTW